MSGARSSIGLVTGLLLTVLAPADGTPQADGAPQSGPAAFLFFYRPKAEASDLFDRAYRRHLAWHEQHGDPLPWYAWYVTAGPRVGLFVDGTFGVPFSALDARVSPREDAADFAQTAGAFADAVDQRIYRLRPELSTATALESGAPHASVDVLDVLVTPGAERAFEEALAGARQAWMQHADRPAYASYQLVTGGELPAYLIMLGKAGWTTYDSWEGSALDLVLGTSIRGSARAAAQTRGLLRSVHSETWTYRPDLTLRGATASK